MNRTKQVIWLSTLILIVFGFSIGMVSADDSEQHEPIDYSDPALIERGYEVYTNNVCTACHGQNGEGTDLAPALAEHSEFAIRRQIRAPVGLMLVFSPDAIPTEDLDALIAYILNLETGDDDVSHEHGAHMGIPGGDMLFAHHWMLWLALENEDLNDAIHEVTHTMEHVEGIHLPKMEAALTALNEGNMEVAHNLVEPMVTDVGIFNDDEETVTLQMVYHAVNVEDHESALHFFNHFNDHASDNDLAFSISLLEYIEANEFGEAKSLLDNRLDGDVNFVPQTDDMDMSDMDMHDDDADDHDADEDDHDADDADHDADEDDHDADHDAGEEDHDMDMSDHDADEDDHDADHDADEEDHED